MAEKKVIISGEIGFFGTMPMDVRQQLSDAAGEDVDIHISSPGGSMSDGFEIYNMIRDYKRDNPSSQITITLKGEASSMASYIAVNPAADLVVAEDNATFMIHNPWNLAIGDYREMEKMSSVLKGFGGIIAKAYADRAGKSVDDIHSLMDAETWYFGEEIKAAGFVDEIVASDDGQKVEKDEAIAASRLRFSAMQEKIRQDDRAKADILKVAALFKNEIHAQNEQKISGAAAPQNNNGGATMADNDQNMISADDVTMEWLEANKPDLITAIKNAATEEEKTRQQEIDETEENTDDDSEEAKALFKAARYGEKPMNSGELAKKLFAMQAERKKKALAERKDDGKDVPAIKTDPKAESEILSGIKAGIKMRRIK